MTPETWHVDIDTTAPALERFARALLLTGAALLPSRLILGAPLGRGVSAFVVVTMPPGQAERFREVCRPIRMAMRADDTGGVP
jgi:hypothetical protein